MGFIEHPADYHVGAKFKATNIVFPIVERNGRKKYIVKMPRRSTGLAYKYYAFQDQWLYGLRESCSGKKGIEREAEVLKKLQGDHAPRLEEYQEGVLVREYIYGEGIKEVSLDKKRKLVEGSLEALAKIHEKKVIVGGAHIKNVLMTTGYDWRVCWVDFDGRFDESDEVKARAVDLIQTVYSVYAETHDADLTVFAASRVKKYPLMEVKKQVAELVSERENSIGWWFATRIPRDGKLDAKIKVTLTK
ncbi:MAG: hypothetical protein WC595_03455 [Candidatus Nanoarchaeia archaeon]